MAKMFKAIVSVLIVITAFLFAGCADGWHYENAPAKTTVKVWADPVDSTTINLVDSTGNILVTNYTGHGWAWVKTEPTKYADAKEAWAKAETLYKSFSKQVNTTDFRYNHGVNTIESGVKIIATEDRIFDLEDKKVELTKSQEIPLWKPENLNLKGGEPTTNVREGKLYYAETSVKYSLCYNEVVLAEGIQEFVAEEGYVPSFLRAQVIDRDKHNVGTVEAKLANNKVNISCLDSLLYAELFDGNSLCNEGRLPFHSFNECSLSISGTEVNDTTAVVGKSWTGGSASLGGFELSTSWLSNKVSEKSLVATMSTGAKVDFIDSVHVCKWVPVGGTVLSTKKVRLDYAREGVPADKVSVEVGIDLTQREKPVTLVRVDSTFKHNAFVPNATVSGNNMAVICNNTATFQKVWSNGTKDGAANVGYKWTNNFTVSYNSSMSVDDKSAVLGRHNLNNGTVTVAGYTFTVTYKNRACDDIMYNNKNYKQYAPICKATAVAINIAENGLTVIYDGEGETVTGNLPLTVTEKPHNPDFPGRIVWGGATDSYVDGANVATWEGTYMHFVVENNGAYKVYSRKVGTNGWNSTDVSAAYVATITNSRAVAYIGNTAAGYSLGSCQWQDQGSWTKIVYFDANGGVARVISEISKTIGGESSNNCRMPLRGTWANGKITVDGTTYTVTGSED